MKHPRTTLWLWILLAGIPATVVAQAENPRAERLARVEDWVGITASELTEGGVTRLWDLPDLKRAAAEAMGTGLSREALRPAGQESPVTREGAMLRWGWCRRGDCSGFGYVFVVDPRRGDLFVCRNADSGKQGWMGTDPRMHIPIRGRPCDAANVTEFIRLNTR